MKAIYFLTIALVFFFTPASLARPVAKNSVPHPINESTPWVRFAPTQNKTAVDTLYIMGGPGRWDGSFETPSGQPNWHGWTHNDIAVPEFNHWHISTYWAEHIEGHEIGNHAMYCGDETIPACSEQDTIGGVGDNFFDDLDWRYIVPDPTQPTTVQLTGKMVYDLTDTDWDFLELFINRGIAQEMLASWTGTGDSTVDLDFNTVLEPGEYSGPNSDEVRLWWRVWSDGGYSDVDCMAPGHGACQIDDLSVFIDGNLITFDDFEPGSIVNWNQSEFRGVGDFANLRNDLGSTDPCQTNYSYQVNFVDDGLVVPQLPGTPCISYCYDPGGWIVNNDGGLLADDSQNWFLENQVVSPPLAWVAGHDAAILSFDVYVDEVLNNDSAGVFYQWEIRSTDSEDPADLQSADWRSRNYIYNGGPEFRRHEEPISDLLHPERKWVQIALIVNEAGWHWGWNGSNGTPAPYFDNVALKTWSPQGPEILVERQHLFADAFPTADTLDPVDLAANSCRVDPSTSYYNSPAVGDSMLIKAAILRLGATAPYPPSLHWVLNCNPTFDSVRPGIPNAEGLLRGMVEAEYAFDYSGNIRPDFWTFDLQDEGWFFPGDILHYYITAADQLQGDIRTSSWPADTNSILDFSTESLFPSELVARALPTLSQPMAGAFSQPSILIVDSEKAHQAPHYWIDAMRNMGYIQNEDFDVFKIVPGFIGAAATTTAGDLSAYETMIYTSGNNKYNSITEHHDQYSDLTLLSNWLDLGNKQALFAGDGLCARLPALNGGFTFSIRLGVEAYSSDIANANGGRRDLQINPLSENGVLPDEMQWAVDGGCPDIKSFDAIGAIGSGFSCATLDPVGSTGGTFAAVIAAEEPSSGNRTMALPFDLGSLDSPTARADFLQYLLAWLSSGVSAAGDTPGVGKIIVRAHPNPFNPSTAIAFDLPREMNISLDIFDVQGRHIQSLLDESPHMSGQHQQVWNGLNSQGQVTASGVYFFMLRAEDQKHVGKLTLLK